MKIQRKSWPIGFSIKWSLVAATLHALAITVAGCLPESNTSTFIFWLVVLLGTSGLLGFLAVLWGTPVKKEVTS